MLGSATLVMKKSMIGMKAPASRMNTPNGCSPPASAVARAEPRDGLAWAGWPVEVTVTP